MEIWQYSGLTTILTGAKIMMVLTNGTHQRRRVMAHLSFTAGQAPHFIPEITCTPYAFQGKPVLKVENAVPAPKPEDLAKKGVTEPKSDR
jgi:hypothetical protein